MLIAENMVYLLTNDSYREGGEMHARFFYAIEWEEAGKHKQMSVYL